VIVLSSREDMLLYRRFVSGADGDDITKCGRIAEYSERWTEKMGVHREFINLEGAYVQAPSRYAPLWAGLKQHAARRPEAFWSPQRCNV